MNCKLHEFVVEATLCNLTVIELYLLGRTPDEVLDRVKQSKDIVSAYITQSTSLS